MFCFVEKKYRKMFFDTCTKEVFISCSYLDLAIISIGSFTFGKYLQVPLFKGVINILKRKKDVEMHRMLF